MRILLICGSTRAGSTNRAAQLTAQPHAPDGVECELFDRLTLLPHFNPDDEQLSLPPLVVELRTSFASASAVLFSTPDSAGTPPGSFKNLLDWAVGGREMNEKPCVWLNVAPPGRGEGENATLNTVLGSFGVWVVAPPCVAALLGREQIDANGLVADTDVRSAIDRTPQRVVGTVRRRRRVMPCVSRKGQGDGPLRPLSQPRD